MMMYQIITGLCQNLGNKESKFMSQIQYNEIGKIRLIDIPQLPAGLLIKWLATRPIWMQERVIKQLTLMH